MKILITALLSALLIWIAPSGTPVNKSTTVRAKAKTVQAVTPEKVAEVTQAPTEQKPVVEPAAVVIPQTPPVLSTHEQLMNQAGIQPKDYGAADYIIFHESSWREFAQEPHSGAYGLCQGLPAIKMASAGSDWQTNPVTQLKWCNSYAQTRYGGWQGAYAHWVADRWW
jgi:hypothetical protein